MNALNLFTRFGLKHPPNTHTTKPLMVGALCAMLLGACQPASTPAGQADTQNGSTANAATGRTLRIATEGAYRPFNYTNADGSLDGFDVDIAKALCAELKARCEIKAQDWDGIIPALNAHKYDAIVSAMSVTPERAAQVDFTEPYFDNMLVFLARDNSTFNPDDTAQIDSHTLTAQRSTISAQWLADKHPNANVKLYDTLDNAFMDLAAGRADAMVADRAPALAWLQTPSGQGFSQKGAPIDIQDKLAVAVRRGDPLKGEINSALAAIRSNGTYDRIVQQHFGGLSAHDSVASSVTAASAASAATSGSTSQP